MKGSKKFVFVREMKGCHFLASVFFFSYAWLRYKIAYGILLAFRYNFFVVGLYGACLLFLIRIYNAYSVEYSSWADCGFSLSLSSAISILSLYFATLIAWKRYYPIRIFLILIGVQTAWNFIWAFLANWLYVATQPAVPTAIIYRNPIYAHKMDGVFGFEKRFHLNAFVEDPQSAEEIIEAMGDCGAVVLADIDRDLRDEMVTYCAEKGIRTFLLPGVGDTILMSGTHMQSFSVPVVRVWPDIYPEYLFVKRFADIFLSALAIVITSPIMAITALCIHNYDKGPALYRQVRLTRGGREFEILKFRSMRMDAEADGVARLSSGEDDPRITPIGRAIRMIRLDELPQLFNVLKGDMSLVGPRPERPEIAAQYEKEIPEFRLRLAAKAGLTGYAQVYGKYNSDPYEKLQMDILYINRMGPFVDLRILFATVRVLFMKESTAGITKDSTTALHRKKENIQRPAPDIGTGIWEPSAETRTEEFHIELEEIPEEASRKVGEMPEKAVGEEEE